MLPVKWTERAQRAQYPRSGGGAFLNIASPLLSLVALVQHPGRNQ